MPAQTTEAAVLATDAFLQRLEVDFESFQCWEDVDIPSEDIDAWVKATGLDLVGAYNCLGERLAEGFQQGRYTFDFCDPVVNVLIGSLDVYHFGDESWPKFLWEVYLAFDAGEYYRHPDEDPVETYARPRIAELVAQLLSRVV